MITKAIKYSLCIALISATILTLTSCASRQQMGAGLGAITGGLIGNRFGGGSGQAAATILGAGAGAVIGNQVGKSMDQSEKNTAALQSMRDSQHIDSDFYGNEADYSYPS